MAIAASAAFTAAVVFLMSPRQVRYFNVRAANLPDMRTAAYPGEAHATADSPFLFFGADEVVLGTVASVVAPKPAEGVIVAPRARWKETLLADGRLGSVLPGARSEAVFVVGFDDRLEDAGDVELAREVADFARRAGVGGDTRPALVFARVPASSSAPARAGMLGQGGHGGTPGRK